MVYWRFEYLYLQQWPQHCFHLERLLRVAWPVVIQLQRLLSAKWKCKIKIIDAIWFNFCRGTNVRVRTLFVLKTWECPASLGVFDEVIVVGYWGCCRRLWPAGIDLAKPVAVWIEMSKIYYLVGKKSKGVVAKMIWLIWEKNNMQFKIHTWTRNWDTWNGSCRLHHFCYTAYHWTSCSAWGACCSFI